MVDDFLLLIFLFCRTRRGHSFFVIVVRTMCYGLHRVRFSVHHFGGPSIVILSELSSWTLNMLLSFILTLFGEPPLPFGYISIPHIRFLDMCFRHIYIAVIEYRYLNTRTKGMDGHMLI